MTSLTLGSPDDEEPFLKVGEFGVDEDHNDKAEFTAYIIRQVPGDVDGTLTPEGNLPLRRW